MLNSDPSATKIESLVLPIQPVDMSKHELDYGGKNAKSNHGNSPPMKIPPQKQKSDDLNENCLNEDKAVDLDLDGLIWQVLKAKIDFGYCWKVKL